MINADTTSPFYLLYIYGNLSSGVKPPGREADLSPPSSAEVKNEWSYTSTALIPSWHAKRRV
jgi:hypothetical protein